MSRYAGLDLSMETTAICVVDKASNKIASMTVESTPAAIAEPIAGIGSVERAVIETGRMAAAICLGLRELGLPVVCVDAV